MSNWEAVKRVLYGILRIFAVFGVQNVIAIILLLWCLKSIITNIIRKEYTSLIVPGILTVFLCYSLFTLQGNVRLMTAQYGYPGIGYTFSGKIIQKEETGKKWMKYKVTCDTGKTDYEGKAIMPQIDVFKFGPLYYSIIWNSRI
jgi:hypothetical protein